MLKPYDFIEVFLQPGEVYFGDEGTRIRTLLGSCVAVVLWHPDLHVGGMCHFLLPTRDQRPAGEWDGRYGDEAIPMLVAEARQSGCPLDEFQVKLFGGGNMFGWTASSARMEIGNRNIEMAERILAELGLELAARHVGGAGHRNLMFDLWKGDVWMKFEPVVGAPANPDAYQRSA